MVLVNEAMPASPARSMHGATWNNSWRFKRHQLEKSCGTIAKIWNNSENMLKVRNEKPGAHDEANLPRQPLFRNVLENMAYLVVLAEEVSTARLRKVSEWWILHPTVSAIQPFIMYCETPVCNVKSLNTSYYQCPSQGTCFSEAETSMKLCCPTSSRRQKDGAPVPEQPVTITLSYKRPAPHAKNVDFDGGVCTSLKKV